MSTRNPRFLVLVGRNINRSVVCASIDVVVWYSGRGWLTQIVGRFLLYFCVCAVLLCSVSTIYMSKIID